MEAKISQEKGIFDNSQYNMPFSHLSINNLQKESPSNSEKAKKSICTHLEKIQSHKSRATHSKSSLSFIKMKSPMEILKKFSQQSGGMNSTMGAASSTRQSVKARRTRTNSNLSIPFPKKELMDTRCFDLHNRFRIRASKPTSNLHNIIKQKSLQNERDRTLKEEQEAEQRKDKYVEVVLLKQSIRQTSDDHPRTALIKVPYI